MAVLQEREKTMVSALKLDKVTSLDHVEVARLRKQAMKLSRKGKHSDAGCIYGALAEMFGDDLDFPLRAAHHYEKAGESDDAARWFIQSAVRYARQNYPTQAVATLRLYHALKPDDYRWPKRIYKLCRSHGDGQDILPFLSRKDQAGRRLHGSDIFSMLDDASFDTLLDKMEYRKLKNKEVLVQMGDTAKSLFFVVYGAIEGYLTIANTRTYLGVVEEGGLCGESAYFTGGKRSTEMLARGDTEVLELPYALIDSLKEKSPHLNERLESLYKENMLVKQLALTPVFRDIGADYRRRIAAKMTLLEVPSGQALFKEGEESADLYIVRSGWLAVNVLVDGVDHLLKTIETGGVVGEISIITGNKRTATVRSVSSATLMKLDAADYRIFCRECTPLKNILYARKKQQMDETRDLIKNIGETDGDDTCKLLLKDIWQSRAMP